MNEWLGLLQVACEKETPVITDGRRLKFTGKCKCGEPRPLNRAGNLACRCKECAKKQSQAMRDKRKVLKT